MNDNKTVLNPITEQQFDRVAMATERGQLQQKNDEFGVSFSIWLNGHIVMSSNVDVNGQRHYWSHL
ncbi:hypothetical protein L4D77_19245 [Photobacterium frigidiphilum]|uniref:hypothetical protein n=1 Tax=Photobacterium frigidiphilum TaxID=264736 RepID=UPI003D09D6E8